MVKRKILELIVTNGDSQDLFSLDSRPVLIGNLPSCQIQVHSQDGQKGVKAVLSPEDGCLKVKAFTKEFAVELNDKKYKTATFKDSVYFKLGNIDIVLNVEEAEMAAPISSANLEPISELDDLEDYNESIPSAFSVETDKMIEETRPSIPNLLQELTPPPVKEEHVEAVVESRLPESTPEILPEQIETESFFDFSILFDESSYKSENNFSYAKDLDYSGYVDPEDETIEKLPIDNFTKESDELAVHVAHIHNGTTLTDRYFELEQKKVFISNKKSNKRTFQAHDWINSKNEFIHNRNGKTIIAKLDGYSFKKVDANERVVDLSANTVILGEGERIVLSNGTSQIVVKLDKQPPTLRKDSPLELDDKLIKILACFWLAVLIPSLSIMMLVDIPKKQEPKKEVVVILKRKPQPTRKSTASANAGAKAPAPQKAEKKVTKKEPQRKAVKVEKKVVKTPVKAKPTPVKKVMPKPAPKVAKATPTPTPVKAAPAPKAQARKAYKFNTASKMKSLLGGKLSASSAGSPQKVSVSVGSAVGTNQISNASGANVGAVSNSVSKFSTGSGTTGTAWKGTRGLSGKTGTDTTYAEGNARVLGSLDPNLIRKIMREYIPQFRYCYQKELMKNENVAGVFDLNFHINGSGKGINVNVVAKGEDFSQAGVKCLSRVVDMIKFPKPPGGNLVDVKQPLNFQQNRKAAGSY